GNHGRELRGPGGEHVARAVAASTAAVRQLAANLAKSLEGISGVAVEDKGLSATVHYRHAAPERHEAVRSAVHGVLSDSRHPFVLTAGRMCFDLRPRVYWNKGEAVKWLAAHVGQPAALVVFVGGDPTDEDAF